MEENREESGRILTAEEMERILQAPDSGTRTGLRDRAILALLGGAGLKVQELVLLRQENIDLQISCVLFPGNPVRMIPFGISVRECLMQYLYEVRKEMEGPSSLLFPGRGGKILTRQAVWKIVKKYAEAAGIETAVSPEDLRTSLAVSLLQRGAHPSAVQSLLGIRSASMNKYLRILEEEKPDTLPPL